MSCESSTLNCVSSFGEVLREVIFINLLWNLVNFWKKVEQRKQARNPGSSLPLLRCIRCLQNPQKQQQQKNRLQQACLSHDRRDGVFPAPWKADRASLVYYTTTRCPGRPGPLGRLLSILKASSREGQIVQGNP